MIRTYISQYQEIIVEKTDDDLRLTIAWDLQFSSKEEYIYNEAMVDYPMSVLKNKETLDVLILGWWDGLLANELMKYSNIDNITLCELDKEVIKICSEDIDICEYNGNVFRNPRLHVLYGDAFEFINNTDKRYDLIIADFPNPHLPPLSKLYSIEFYQNISNYLREDGIFIAQVAEVHHTKKCFQCVWKTLKEVFVYTRGFSRYMEHTMGHLGFVLWSQSDILGDISVEQEVVYDADNVVVNTVENMQSFTYFNEETMLSWFIPWVTNT